jgi:hypothetical protein
MGLFYNVVIQFYNVEIIGNSERTNCGQQQEDNGRGWRRNGNRAADYGYLW